MQIQDINKAINLIETSADKSRLARNFTVSMLKVFFYVAEHPACTQKEIQNNLNLSAGNMSGLMRGLGAGGSTSTVRKGGYNLIKEMLSFEDYRQKEYFLTDKGVKLVAKIKNL